jgi:pSer/pThr/pTyr-binding forkhead associated (FHA) protein
MSTAIRITVLTGPHKNRKYSFAGPTRCQVGRGADCLVRLTGTDRDMLISRNHCQLDIKPPYIEVRDLGSRNGTYINGKQVTSSLKEILSSPTGEVPGAVVNNGDLLTIGGTTLRVDIVDCPLSTSGEGRRPAM